MQDVTLADLRLVLGTSSLNLIRRGADGSLRLSVDRWRFEHVTGDAIVFRALSADVPASHQFLEVPLDAIERITWDRLPRQRVRSQLRFHLRTGDLWTFSGELAEPPTP